MGECIDCKSVDKKMRGLFKPHVEENGERAWTKSVVWCDKKEALVFENDAPKCFKHPLLSPCRFCGGAGLVFWPNVKGDYQMRCERVHSCRFQTPIYNSEEEAREAWEKLNKV